VLSSKRLFTLHHEGAFHVSDPDSRFFHRFDAPCYYRFVWPCNPDSPRLYLAFGLGLSDWKLGFSSGLDDIPPHSLQASRTLFVTGATPSAVPRAHVPEAVPRSAHVALT